MKTVLNRSSLNLFWDKFGVLLAASVCLATLVFFRWRMLWLRHLDEDELEHLHAAWCVAKGMVPYRDFSEYHPPLLYYLLSPFFAFFNVEQSADNAFGFILFGRILMGALMVITLLLTIWLGKLVINTRAGVVAAALLMATTFFQEKALEIRPDNPALVFWLASLLSVLAALRQDNKNRKIINGLFLMGGFFFGMTLVSTQKILMVTPGLAVAGLLYLYEGKLKNDFAARWNALAACLCGLSLPILAVTLFFYANHAVGALYYYNFIVSLGWKVRLNPFDYIWQLICQNPFLAIATLTGFIVRWRRLERMDYFLIPVTLSLVIGLFILPEPYRQYYLTFLPLLAVYAAQGFFEWLAWIDTIRSRFSSTRQWPAGIFAALLLALALFYPLKTARHEAFHADTRIAEERLSKIRFIMENTGPEDTVMEGWPVYGIFRPHAVFYFYPNREIQAMIEPEKIQEILEKLRSGAINPKLISFDHSVRHLSPGITAYIEAHYKPTSMEGIWKRGDDTKLL